MLNRATSEAVEPVVGILRVDTTTVEVQVPTIRCGVERCRPVVAVRTTIVPRRAIAVARARKEDLRVTALHESRKGPGEPSCLFDFSLL